MVETGSYGKKLFFMVKFPEVLGCTTYFSTLSHTNMIFRKILMNKKCVLIFSTNVVYNISHSKKRIQ
jgi:hypothetical protein